MSEMFHFPKFSYVAEHFRVEISFDRFSRQFEDAQQNLGEMVLRDCIEYMPKRYGILQDMSHTENGGRRVVFPGPYARYQYMGKAMVDSVTGKGPRKIQVSPGEFVFRFREGAKLIPTERRLTYSNPQATDHWFDAAKAQHGEYWIEETKRKAGGRR